MDARTRSVLETYDEGETDPVVIAKLLKIAQFDVRAILAQHRGMRPLADAAAIPINASRDIRTALLLTAGDQSMRQRTRTLAARVRSDLDQLQTLVAAEQYETHLRQQIADATAQLRQLRKPRTKETTVNLKPSPTGEPGPRPQPKPGTPPAPSCGGVA